MHRRYWPAALAIFALLLFGSFLSYTQFLLRQIREQDRIYSQMYATVQRGLTSLEEGGDLDALIELQKHLKQLDVPLVVQDPDGGITAVNPPFDDTVGSRRFNRYVRVLEARNRYITSPYVGTIYFGYPPIVRWLRWVPWLQAGAGLLLVMIAIAIVRSNVRGERERMWAAMARELAHQMGTPLSSLAGWVEVLQLPAEERTAFGSEDRIATMIGADAERLERVSRRFELIGKPPRREPISIARVVYELDNYFRPRLPRLGSGIDLKTRARSGLPDIEANFVLLVWALENVVKNAIDALAGRGGKILVSASGDERIVRVNISDNGPGIAPDVRRRIFEAGISTKSSGWGVGLSLTQRIVEDLHGGRITVHDRRRGGTIFEIELPAAGKRLKRSLFNR